MYEWCSARTSGSRLESGSTAHTHGLFLFVFGFSFIYFGGNVWLVLNSARASGSRLESRSTAHTHELFLWVFGFSFIYFWGDIWFVLNSARASASRFESGSAAGAHELFLLVFGFSFFFLGGWCMIGTQSSTRLRQWPRKWNSCRRCMRSDLRTSRPWFGISESRSARSICRWCVEGLGCTFEGLDYSENAGFAPSICRRCVEGLGWRVSGLDYVGWVCVCQWGLRV